MTIPADETVFGPDAEIYERNNQILQMVLDSLARPTSASQFADANTRKLGIFYRTCMDSVQIEAAGTRPLAHALARIAAIASPAAVRGEVARLHQQWVDVLFRFDEDQDFKNARQVIAQVSQGGLGLPNREYYLRDDSASAQKRRDYVAHVARTLALLGETADAARVEADRIMMLETALARASMTYVAQRDPNAIYHKMTPAELQALTPTFNWAAYVREIGLRDVRVFNVAQPDYLRAVNGLLITTPIADWKAYLRWHLADAASLWMGSAFVNEKFRFQSSLSGQQVLQPRQKRCLRVTEAHLGQALGKVYVERTFSPAAKAGALELVRNLKAAFRERLIVLDWMTDATRQQALAKLDKFTEKIGYPDHWRDYSMLSVADTAFVLNVFAANRFEFARELGMIDRPVDRASEWMTPSIANAGYTQSLNEIAFTAAILQPPLFDPNAEDAVNYGAIGVVIGHEMTHGFDDEGRQFDSSGNLHDWWAAPDVKRYAARAALLVDQFNNYIVVDTLHANGRLTLGENIADLGGVALAYAAFEHAMRGKPRHVIDGFTPEQRFFLAYAQVAQLDAVRPETMRRWTLTNPHSVPRWRTNGPLSNLPEFARAWGCKEGDPMVRPEQLRVQIW